MAALIFVVLAEMGDKTQLLGMAFATRFRWQTVMWGVFAATAANHLLAAAAGSYLTLIVPLGIIKVAAAVSFIGFGLWTIRGDQLSGEDQCYQFSPFWTVTIAFFMAEMGDKTQLATISLAVEYNSVINVWMGTTLGMMISNAFGIIVGIVMGKKIPERAIKWGSALIFIAFGAVGLYENLPEPLLTPLALTVEGLTILLLVALVAWRNNKKTVLAPVREKQDSLDRNRMKM
jgi:putative Ca2+/H+ antiporter (TMEM165/GDT1 family)